MSSASSSTPPSAKLSKPMEYLSNFIPFEVPSTLCSSSDQTLDQPLGLADSQVIDTQNLHHCSVSTTLTDLVPCQVGDTRTGEKHDGCVVFLQYKFGEQNPNSHNRITSMRIEVEVVQPRLKDIESRVSSHSALDSIDSAVQENHEEPPYSYRGQWNPLIRHIFPTTANSKPTDIKTKSFKTLGIDPAFNCGSIASASVETEKQYCIPETQSMHASPSGTKCAIWKLYENNLLKDGVPSVVNTAMVVQTEGLPFELEVRFEGRSPILGLFTRKGERSVIIGSEILEVREMQDGDERFGLGDVRSVEFLEWVEARAGNSWAEETVFET